MSECRKKIITTYAGWTVLSALRSGAGHVKAGKDVYPLLDTIDFPAVLLGSQLICPTQFDEWHRVATEQLSSGRSDLCVGWAAKMVNVYLKTAVYIGDLGRPGLREVLHPPIDSGLWNGLKARFKGHPLLRRTHVVESIKAILDYSTYQTIIEGCRLAAAIMGCSLIEVEQLWDGARSPD